MWHRRWTQNILLIILYLSHRPYIVLGMELELYPEALNRNYWKDCRTSTTCNTLLTENGIIYDTDNSLSHDSEYGVLHYNHDNLTVNDVT